MTPAIVLNVATVDGELLEQIRVPVTADPMYPVGKGMERAAILAQIEDVARIVQARLRGTS